MDKRIYIPLLGVIVLAVAIGIFIQNRKSPVTNTTHNTNVATTSNANVVTNTSGTSVAECDSAHLTAALTDGEGTAGTYYYNLALKNTGSENCSMTGPSGVVFQDAAGKTLNSISILSAPSLQIAPGATAYSAVGFPNASNFTNTSTCTSGVVKMVIYPGSNSTPLVITGLDSLNVGYTNYACRTFSATEFSTTKQ